MKMSFLSVNGRYLVFVGAILGIALASYIGWGSIRQYVAPENRTDEVSQRREADDPEGRASWFMYQRMYPFNSVPDGARRAAWDDATARGLFVTDLGAGSTWNPIGPMPTAGAGPGGAVSGRINEIAISPANTQIVLVAGATGGIWRSTDGGTTFSPVTDNQVDLAVGAIAFAPSDANIVYAGMGDRDNTYFGSGILKSTDAGATWTRVNTTGLSNKGLSTSIKVDPANPNKVYLAQFQALPDTPDCSDRGSCGAISGVWISNDGGATWNRTLEGLATDLVIHPTNAQIIYAALRYGATDATPRGLYKSTDGGATWNISLASPYTASESATKDFRVAVTPAAPDRVYAYFGSDGPPKEVRLEMSNDAGATWTSRGVVTNTATGLDQGQLAYNTYLVADPTNADTVWVGCRDFFKSTDGGVTFANLNGSFQPPYPDGPFTEGQQKVHTDQQSFAFLPGNPSTFFVGNDGGIFKTTDGGATFTSLNATLSLTQFVGFVLHPTDGTRSYAGAQDNGTQRRTPGTNGWVEFTATGDGGKIAINPVDRTVIFAGSTEGKIERNGQDGTPNSQVTIANAASFEAGNPARIEFYAPVITNGVDARLYSGSWRLYTCSDCSTSTGLGTWTLASQTDLTKGGNDVLTAIAVAKSNTNVIYTGSRDGRAMVSTDNGANWNIIETGLPNRTITDISVSATDPTLVYLSVSGYGSGHVFRSADSGTTWTNISNNLPDIPTSAFLIDPMNPATLYAGTDIGVFRSTDTGATWTAFNNGLPPIPVSGFSAQATGRIQVATYGRGVFELSPAQAGPMVSVGDATAQERPSSLGQSDPLEFTVSLSEPSNQQVTIRVSTSGITATEGGDFQSVDDLEVVFPPNTMTQTVLIPLIDDPGDEPDETFALDITNASNANVEDGEGIGTIIDDDPPATGVRSRLDFDGDGKTDISVFRPSEGNWYLSQSTAGFAAVRWGLSTDTLVPGDYDGDGKTDTAIFRASNDQAQPDYYILNSAGFTVSGVSWGLVGDVPVTGDYDGDGKTDIAVFRPSSAVWYILNSGNGTNTVEPFGQSADIPLTIDNDGDGKTNLAVFRPANHSWYIARPTGTPATNFIQVPFGIAGDRLVPADYDGDGKDDVAVWRPSNGTWYILRSSIGAVRIVQFGVAGDVPVPGDYDGDGKNDQAIYRNGVWWINQSTSGVSVQNFGVTSDAPIPAVLTRFPL